MDKRMDILIKKSLFEQGLPEKPVDDEDESKEKDDDSKSKQEKEKEKDTKNIKDMDKDDLEDEEETTADEEDIAVAVNLNYDNRPGKIKFVSFKKLNGLSSVEALLSLFDIDPENAPEEFKDRLVIKINSPIPKFDNEEYLITLMDKVGELSINRPNFQNIIVKKSQGSASLQQVAQQQLGAEEETVEEIDLSYIPELDYEFIKAVKNEFFDRILKSKK